LDPLHELITPRPFYLRWHRQGKIDWNSDWVDRYGPTRSSIPGLDEHVSFANYDLRLNRLPEIETAPEGRLFVQCPLPFTAEDLALASERSLLSPPEKDAAVQAAITCMRGVAGILNVVQHHGFDAADDTAGLRYLNSVLPREPLRRAN
jgi:hypothetical protein